MRINEARVTHNTVTYYNNNLALIAGCEFLFTATLAISNTLTGIVGKSLTSDMRFITAPYAMMTLMAALSTIGASALMQRVGRQKGFFAGAIAAILGGSLAALSIVIHDFWLFCSAFGLLGIYKAFAQYYRFAAAEVGEEKDLASKSRAVSIVLIGSFIAAISGPWIGTSVRDGIPSFPYAGSFATVALMGILSLVVIAFLKIPKSVTNSYVKAQQTNITFLALVRRPKFAVAIVSATIGYSVMSFCMVSAPLALIGYGYTVSTVALVMQFHVAGMYGPSFFTGKLIANYGAQRMILIGCLLQVSAALIAMFSSSVLAFTMSLFLCGVGWNFMYIGATVLLTDSCSTDERAKAQGSNEFIMFSVVTVCSLAAGPTLAQYGWHGVQMVSMGAILAVVFFIVFMAVRRKPPEIESTYSL